MKLEGNYFQIDALHMGAAHGVFYLRLLPGCDVYRGHFPGNPVCPGVCHIEMLRECVMKLVGVKVFISSVKQCRLTAVSDPLSCSELKLTVSLEKTDERYAVSALLEDEEKTYMEYRGSMAVDL